MWRACILSIRSFMPLLVAAQGVVNGPMPGYVDHFAAHIWLQCHQTCSAHLEYWPTTRPDSILKTGEIVSDPEKANAMTFTLDRLEPGMEYTYAVVVDDKPIDLGTPLKFTTRDLWKYRKDPPDLVVATGSCAYINETAYDRPGTPYGDGYGIFDAIAASRPDLMIWLGDNMYLREPDWGTWQGYMHRYTHLRSLPELQTLLHGTQHYAIWDDHDYGPNDADATWVHAPMAREAFALFWPNPTYGAPGVPGITTAFNCSDVDFFLLDDRSFRIPSEMVTMRPTMLGQAQVDWLVQALRYSDATWKVVALGSEFLSTAAVFENYATFADERRELIERIDKEGIRGVVFITGDRHFAELSELDLPDGRWILDLTSSPLTSGPYHGNETNDLRVPGTYYDKRNFALLKFTGRSGSRRLTFEVHATNGELIWSRTYDAPH
ncbi:MAG: alkaline phosphatase family protein [Flavobacteriales bacterium]|nr:alkaline phosphatase family protein [Flavobacteriales bacterium]MCB9168249.1 alkaline phosphatase family protein [Flavobacteriales bacterium]